MGFTALTVQTLGTDGTELGTTAAVVGGVGSGNSFQNDGNVRVRSENTGTDAATVTVLSGAQLAGLTVEDEAIAVAAGSVVTHGPYSRNVWNKQSGDDRGKVQMEVSGDGSADIVYSAFT